MSLRSKIVLILVTVIVAYAALDNVLQRFFADRSFGRLEREHAGEELEHVRRRLEGELVRLGEKGRLYAGLGALSRFVGGTEPAFGAEELGSGVLEEAGVDVFYVCDSRGQVLWGSVLEADTRAPMRLTELPREALSPNHEVLFFRGQETSVAGVLMTSAQPLLFCTTPIPDGQGRLFLDDDGWRRPRHGTLVLGRFLAESLKRELVRDELAVVAAEDQDGRRVELLESGASALPTALLASADERHFLEGEDGFLHAYARVDAVRAGLPLFLHVALDRPIEAHKRRTVNFVLLSTLIGGLLILVVLLRLLQHIVIAPLSTLTQKAIEIGRRDDTTIRVGLERPDEIGQLAGEFDRMIVKLAKSREQVTQSARLAGRSEVATGVLHNVGNVLNSVNVAANLALRKTEELSVGDLELLAGVLAEHERDLAGFVSADPRGKHLVPFLRELSGALRGQRQAIQAELSELNQGIEHIAELVRAQQSHAGTKGVFELASLGDEIEAALSIAGSGLGAVTVEREFEELPAARVDKHKLMEILVNLIQNACQALEEHGGPVPRLTLRLSRLAEGTARIEVRDNGVGIPAENLTRIFQHGFTTKKNGHGFGLHVSANAATEMGAKLHAESEGPGRGATFCLDIPLEREPARAAA